ncbi:MAG: transporter substrate-binding domain-containing protein [Oscillospiraceae bacterium]|nr:transporter substrate-binding domain-containing protein [Oscillospiraceae bacterium]
MKKFLVLVVVAMVLFTAAGCSKSAKGSGGSDTIVFGTSADYPPFEFHILDDGVDKIVGIDVSLAYQIAADMGKTLQIADMNFDNLLTLMAKGDCDFVIAAIEQTPERIKQASCSDPYFTDQPPMVLVKKGNEGLYKSLDDFAGKTVGAQSATTMSETVSDEMEGAIPLFMASVVDLINNLVYDKCDALLLDGSVALQYAAVNADLAIADVDIGEALPYCVWVAKDDPKGLLKSINATIAKVLSDGSMERFIEEAEELSSQALD